MEPFSNYFFTQGVLGIICIGEFLIIAFLYRENKDLNNKRIQDLQDVQKATVDPLQKIQQTSEEIVKKVEKSNEVLLGVLAKK